METSSVIWIQFQRPLQLVNLSYKRNQKPKRKVLSRKISYMKGRKEKIPNLNFITKPLAEETWRVERKECDRRSEWEISRMRDETHGRKPMQIDDKRIRIYQWQMLQYIPTNEKEIRQRSQRNKDFNSHPINLEQTKWRLSDVIDRRRVGIGLWGLKWESV